MRVFARLLAILFIATSAQAASAFNVVDERDAFVGLVEGKELRIGILGIRLSVLPDGTIEGVGQGYPITGTWAWQEGYFCREMDWGGTVIPYNCQLVEAHGPSRMRFTVDQGAGNSATFNLR